MGANVQTVYKSVARKMDKWRMLIEFGVDTKDDAEYLKRKDFAKRKPGRSQTGAVHVIGKKVRDHPRRTAPLVGVSTGDHEAAPPLHPDDVSQMEKKSEPGTPKGQASVAKLIRKQLKDEVVLLAQVRRGPAAASANVVQIDGSDSEIGEEAGYDSEIGEEVDDQGLPKQLFLNDGNGHANI